MVSGSLAPNDGAAKPVAPTLYSEVFYEHLPYYLSIGMSWEQYWDQDCEMVKYYRQADEIRNKRKNQELWLQGAYVYEAILDASPILHAFAKKNTKPLPYPAEPYVLTAKERKEESAQKANASYERGKAKMSAWAMAINKKFQIQKEVSEDGRYDG